MSTEIIDVADLDCIFLTYDEPKKEEFWVTIQNLVPWAKRVDGVLGSDAAHKAAADASWEAFRNDPEWKKVAEETQRSGKLVEKVESVYLNPTDYSPHK